MAESRHGILGNDVLLRPLTPPPAYSAEKPPDIESPGSKPLLPHQTGQGWWQRKSPKTRMAIVLAVVIVIILVVVLGAVLGSKEKHHSQSITYFGSTPTSSSTPTPSPTRPANLTPTPIVRNVGVGFGAPGDPDSLIAWKLGDDGVLAWKSTGVKWENDENRTFSISPFVVATAADKRTAIAVDDKGAVLSLQYHDGAWDFEAGWLNLGSNTLTRPAAVSRAEGLVDVAIVTAGGEVAHAQFDGAQWSEWETLRGFADGIPVSHVFVGEPALASNGKDSLDVYASTGTEIIYTHWTPDGGWVQDWDNLGALGYPAGSPMTVSFGVSTLQGGSSQITVVAMIHQGTIWYRQQGPASGWSYWKQSPSGENEGIEMASTQMMVGGNEAAPLNVITRSSDNCIHYHGYVGGSFANPWGSEVTLWCFGDEWPPSSGDSKPGNLGLGAVYDGNDTIHIIVETEERSLLYLPLTLPVDQSSEPEDYTSLWKDW